MKKKIFWLVLVALLFVGAQRASAYISDAPLVQELDSPEWQSGSHAFHNITKIIESLAVMIGGTDNETVNQKLGPSALGTTSNLIGYLYLQKPISSVDYFADLGRRLKIAPPAYAQTGGVGFEGLKPILPIWKVFRNIAYAFFTVVFVGMGFAIMFRVKLNPQTVISIQSAIPKVIIALILVTFSYAIAGLLIDLTYVLLSIGVVALNPLAPNINLTEIAADGFGFWQGLGFLLGGAARTAWNVPFYLIGGVVAAGALGALIGSILPIAGTAAGAGMAIGLLLLLLLVVMLWIILKLFFNLIRSYINIILAIIFAPLQIMLGVLPGEQFGFGTWIRNLFANLMVFPAVGLFMIIGWILTNRHGPNWVPPVMGVRGTSLAPIIGFGMLLLVHKVPDMVREALQVKVLPYGAEIGEPFGKAIGLPYAVFTGAGAAVKAFENLFGKGVPPGRAEPPKIAPLP